MILYILSRINGKRYEKESRMFIQYLVIAIICIFPHYPIIWMFFGTFKTSYEGFSVRLRAKFLINVCFRL